MAPGFDQQSAQAPAKRAVGLTSGAFDFAFATPSKSSHKGKGKAVDKDETPLMPMGMGMGVLQTPARVGVDQRSGPSRRELGEEGRTPTISRETITPIREMSTSTRTPRPSLLSVSAAHASMMGGNVKKEESMKTPRKLTTLSSITTPWATSSNPRHDRPRTPDSTSSKRRRLGDLEVHLPMGQKGKEEKEDLGRRVALRHMGEGVRLEGVGQIEDVGKDEGEKEVGIGISPRKGKVKWTGRGEIPLAIRLNSLLTTQTSSLTLFYTSLQHTLHPSHSSRSLSNSTSKAKIEISTGPTPLDHIRTAPLRLLLIRPLTTREHAAQLWLASVRTWPTQPKRGYINGVDNDPPPEEVIVNFSQAAKGAAAAGGPGSDIKVLTGRWWDRLERGKMEDDGAEKWEVGVWSEWSMADIPTIDYTGEGVDEGQSQEIKERKVVFVSRYLIAERR